MNDHPQCNISQACKRIGEKEAQVDNSHSSVLSKKRNEQWQKIRKEMVVIVVKALRWDQAMVTTATITVPSPQFLNKHGGSGRCDIHPTGGRCATTCIPPHTDRHIRETTKQG